MGVDLSIVIPAYNEAHKIARDIESAGSFLLAGKMSGEIIIADDGSGDQTVQTARNLIPPPGIELKVLELEHLGKGSAVREGMRASSGEIAMFADSGVCIPFENAMPMIEAIRSGKCEIAHGSRKMKGSGINRPQTFYPRVLSWR